MFVVFILFVILCAILFFLGIWMESRVRERMREKIKKGTQEEEEV